MNYKSAYQLRPQQLKRRFGGLRSTFKHMVKALQKQLPSKPGRGRQPKLCLEERVLANLKPKWPTEKSSWKSSIHTPLPSIANRQLSKPNPDLGLSQQHLFLPIH